MREGEGEGRGIESKKDTKEDSYEGKKINKIMTNFKYIESD